MPGILAIATADATRAVVEQATAGDALSSSRVLVAAALAAVAMSSVVIGAWLGLTFRPGDRLIANILAFGSGALVNALAVDLAYGTTQHLVTEHVPNLTAWTLVAGGFFAGGLIYFWFNRLVVDLGGAARHKSLARAFALEKKREESGAMLERLARNPILRSLPPVEIERLLPHIHDLKLDAGEELCHQGQPGDAMYLIEEGRLGVFLEAGADKAPGKRIAEIKDGDIVGEMALLRSGVRSATVVAETPVTGMRIDKDDFDHLLSDSPKMSAAVRELAKHRTLASIQQEAAMLDSDAWAKLATESIHQLSASEVEQTLAEHGGDNPLAIWIGNILDAVPGSLVIGATFLGFSTFNPTLLISVFLANLPEAMASAHTMRHARYSNRRIYGLWGSLVLIGAISAALGNILLPSAPVHVLALCEAVAGGAILALVAQVMFPHAYEGGGDVVSLSTIAGFMSGFLLTVVDLAPLARH